MKKSSILAFTTAAIVMGSAGELMAQDHLPILQYHHVGEKTPFSTSVTPAQFQTHMNYLDDAGFNVVVLKDALTKIQQGISLPEKSVAITFDDAYLDIYQSGFPILKEKAFPFTIFINTQPVRQKNKNFLNWDQMREMQRSGVSFANHTDSHPYMLRLEKAETTISWQNRMLKEIDQVEKKLVTELGSSPNMLAYPYGESNVWLRQQLAQSKMIGFGQQSGVVNIDSDFTNLPRFPASGAYAKLSALKTKLASLPMPLSSFVNGGDFADEKAVTLDLTFKEGKYRLKELTCYVSGQGQAKLDWISSTSVKVVAEQAFKYGRGRINCTMPSTKNGQYHWFSNVWIRAKAKQSYLY
jgi:peptidoglycan/xylan/chitin deacetylase (PgdA/CDA1 family)